MADEPKLVVALEARLNKFEKQLSDAGLIADRKVSEIEGRFSKANPKFGPSFLGGFLGGAVGAASLERVADALQRMVSDVAKISDGAERAGVTTAQFQELQFALSQSGGEATQAAPALQAFVAAINKASEGEGKLARFLEANNVTLRDRNGLLKPTAQLLGEVANLIQNAATPQEKLNIATAFFGNSAGPAMVTALSNGAAGLRDFGQTAQNTGQIIDDALIKKAKEIDDKWNALARTWSVTVKSAIISMISAADEFSKKASLAAALDSGTTSARQLAEAIAFARSKGSPVDPSWIKELERLQELERESSRGKRPAGTVTSTLPSVDNSGQPTKTSALNSRAPSADRKDSFERAIDQANKRIAVMQAETAAIDQGTVAREKAKLVAELETAAKATNAAAGKANTEVTAAQRAEIDGLAAAFERARAASEAANGPLRTFSREAADTNKQFQEAAVGGLKSFEDALIGVVQGTQTAQQAFHNMANAIIADLIRIAVRQSITGPLAGALSSFFGGVSSGGVLSGGLPLGMGGIGSNAQGTDNWRGGLTAINEKGPEIIDLPQGTRIIPHSLAKNMRGGDQAVSVTYAPVYNVKGSGPEIDALRQEIANDRMTAPSRIVAAVKDAQSRKILQ